MKDEKLNFFGKVFRQETVEGQKLPVGSICQQLPTICQQIIRKHDIFCIKKNPPAKYVLAPGRILCLLKCV